MTDKDTVLTKCPAAVTVQLIGSKWKLMILDNLFLRTWRFNELQKDLPGISQKVLSDSLRSMEQDGLILRVVYNEVPKRVEYSLTNLGESLRPVFRVLAAWGQDYQAKLSSGSESDS